MTVKPFEPWPLFHFINLYTVGRTAWTGDQSVARPLPTHRINAQRRPCLVGYKPAIPVFERAKPLHTLDRAATVIGSRHVGLLLFGEALFSSA
jgi:hypothetical protein